MGINPVSARYQQPISIAAFEWVIFHGCYSLLFDGTDQYVSLSRSADPLESLMIEES